MRARVFMLAVLLVAACARQFTTVGKTGYTPKWHVGDWWIVKEWGPGPCATNVWTSIRYDLLDSKKIGGQQCFVLQEKRWDTTASRDGARRLYYVRSDNWRIIRLASYFRRGNRVSGPKVMDFPNGVFGFALVQPRFPWFPLDTSSVQDSTFRYYKMSNYEGGNLRQFSRLADSGVMRRYTVEPVPFVARASGLGTGTMFSVLVEDGAPRGSGGADVPYAYSLQLWSSDCPWRLYEEDGQYAPDGTRRSRTRSWLVAVGHKGN